MAQQELERKQFSRASENQAQSTSKGERNHNLCSKKVIIN